MPVASPRRFTVDEYHRLAKAGVLHEDDRVELLHGVITTMLPIGPFHGGTVNYLADIFFTESRNRWLTTIQNPIAIDESNEPEPDVMLLRPREDFYRRAHPTPADVFLVLEVADSTLLLDREEKLPIYARAGLPEVWIVNLPEKIIEVYREPRDGRYASAQRVSPGQPLTPSTFSDVAIDTRALFGE
jgi:Uma2 family endonuclease